MGSSPKKLLSVGLAPDPVSGLVGNAIAKQAPSNDLVKFALPAQAMQKRINEGEGITPRMGLDPGNYFTKSKAQLDSIAAADAWAADAPNRAALAATQSANVSLRAKNLRRRASSLATGADTGGALLQTPTAYGKSSLGG